MRSPWAGADSRGRRVLLVACAVVALLAGDGIGLGVGGHPSGGAGPTMTATGPVVVRSDDRTIIVQASDDGPGCNELPTFTAAETAASVILTLAFRPPPAGNVLCAGVGLSTPESVTVASPIGHRRIIDRSTGRPVAVTDESALPQIPHVPAGHRAGPIAELDPADTGPHAVSRLYPTDTPAVDTIEVDTWQGDNPPPPLPGEPHAAVEVSGHRATLTHILGLGTVESSRLAWTAYGDVIEVQTRPAGTVAAPVAANDAAVLAVARSITAPAAPDQPAAP